MLSLSLRKVLLVLGPLVIILLLLEYHWSAVGRVIKKGVNTTDVFLSATKVPENRMSEWSELTNENPFLKEPVAGRLSLCSGNFKSWNTSLVTRMQPEVSKDCGKLLNGDMEEIVRLNKSTGRPVEPDIKLLQSTSNCSWVQESFNNNLYITKLEESFPIAYSFLIHNNSQQIFRLLRLLYRPHNQYCIAPDLKSGSNFIGIFRNLAKCLGNVHIISQVRTVAWGHKSIMESQMQCYWDLVKLREKQAEQWKWKYVINLCGKELPLTSGHEIVKHLVKLNGSSSINAKKVPTTDERTRWRLRGQTIPHSLPLGKSMTYMSLSFQFINFLFTNSTAIHLYSFFKTIEMPEEHFYPTIDLIPDVPGGSNPNVDHFITANYFWRTGDFIAKHGKMCEGVIVHNICIVGIGDIVSVLKHTSGGNGALFQNKYLKEHDDLIMDCMEERIVAKNKLEHHYDCGNSTST